MAASALEEKINKIRQQNEEIRRRHEEVEEDKKNAAKLNALVQMVPSTDWPERKEPPDFSIVPRMNNKPKSTKEHHEPPQQYHSASGEGRKVHIFAQGQGPPPDPKYNFLADAEREEGNVKSTKEGNNSQNRGQKHTKGTFRRKSAGKDGMQRDYRTNKASHRDEHQPEYEAWRAERNRIDEDRISRQRTAEGNWRREWDNDKVHIVDEVMRPEAKLGDHVKRDHKDFDRRYHNGNDYANHNRSGNRSSYRGNSRHFHNNYENRSNNTYHHHQDGHGKSSASADERTVVATDKSLKVTLSQGNMKGPVMSVKVNSPSIAGTGRVGPRQRSRITYSSHSDVEVASPDTESFSRPKSGYEDKTKGIYHDNLQKSLNSRKTQPPKKKDFSNKSPYFRKKELKRESANENSQKHHETEASRKESQELDHFKPEKPEEDIAQPLKDDKIVTANEKESDANYSDEPDVNNLEINEQNNQNLNSYTDKENYEVCANEYDKPTLQNSDLSESKVETEVETYKTSEEMKDKSDESRVMMLECGTAQPNLADVKDVDDNDKSEIKSAENPTHDADYAKETVAQNEEQNLSTEQIEEIISSDCDSKQSEDMNKQVNDVKSDASSSKEEQEDKVTIPSPTDASSVVEEDNEPESDEKEKEISAIENEIATADETSNKQDVIKCANEAQERTDNVADEEKSGAGSNAVINTIESPKKDLQMENEEAASGKVIETTT